MASRNVFNQIQVNPPFPTNARPAVLNPNDGTVSFLSQAQHTNEYNTIHSQEPQTFRTEFSELRYSSSVTTQVSGRDSRTIEPSYPVINQLPVNRLNMTNNSNVLQHQPSSNSWIQKSVYPTYFMDEPATMSQMDFYSRYQQNLLSTSRTETTQDIQSNIPTTNQGSANNSNINQQSYSLAHQLSSNGKNENSNFFIQQSSANATCMFVSTNSSTDELSQAESRKYQSKYLPVHQQFGRESTMNEGLLSIEWPPAHQRFERGRTTNQSLHSIECSPVHKQFETECFVNFKSNKFLQYSEKVNICVVGPPNCGKSDLLRIFARKRNIQVPKGRPLTLVTKYVMESYGTNLKIDFWYAQDPNLAVEDLKSLCGSTKSAIILVYSVNQKRTLLTIVDWIKLLKRKPSISFPIILVGNKNAKLESTSREHLEMKSNLEPDPYGMQVKAENNLAAFYEFSIDCTVEVETIFLTAVYKAFNKPTQKSVWE